VTQFLVSEAKQSVSAVDVHHRLAQQLQRQQTRDHLPLSLALYGIGRREQTRSYGNPPWNNKGSSEPSPRPREHQQKYCVHYCAADTVGAALVTE